MDLSVDFLLHPNFLQCRAERSFDKQQNKDNKFCLLFQKSFCKCFSFIFLSSKIFILFAQQLNGKNEDKKIAM